MMVRRRFRSSTSFSSASLTAVASRVSPKVPMISPASFRHAILVAEPQATLPSFNVSFSTFATSGIPVRMISRSSASATSAWIAANKSLSLFPMISSGDMPCHTA
jgi:hypothetical protein